MKKTAQSSTFSDNEHKLCLIAVILLIGVVAFFAFKFMKTKNAWQMHSVTTLQSMDNQHQLISNEEAAVMATSIGHYPQANPLYKQPKELETFVMEVSKQTNRDLVVTDTNKTIWADTVAANVGTKYADDQENAVAMTIADGQVRNFVEKSKDYPNGINQSVVALKDASGKIVGAVIFSESSVFK